MRPFTTHVACSVVLRGLLLHAAPLAWSGADLTLALTIGAYCGLLLHAPPLTWSCGLLLHTSHVAWSAVYCDHVQRGQMRSFTTTPSVVYYYIRHTSARTPPAQGDH